MVNVQKHFKLKNKKANPIRVRDDKTKRFKKKYTVDLDSTISFRCSRAFKDSLKNKAERDGVSVTTLINHALFQVYGDELKYD